MPALKTILIIDDDIDDQEILITAIQELDAAILCCTALNGKDALDKLMSKEVVPRLIFLDLNMPAMNGFQFLEHVRCSHELSQIPVVVFSTSSNPADVQQTKKLGAIDFFTKPTSFLKLKQLLIPRLEFIK
jgi:CheY-like chemotaxis protein